MSEQPARPYIGGQAVIEGVMMRSPTGMAVAVRRPDGTLVVKEGPVVGSTDAWRKLPLIRGVNTLVESMSLGMRALSFAADQQMIEAPAEGASDENNAAPATSSAAAAAAKPAEGGGASRIAMGLSMLFGIGLFMALPQGLAAGLIHLTGWNLGVQDFAFHAITGSFKLLVLTTYLFVISRFDDIARVFQYHGAEHKTIFAYEAGLPLTVANVKAQSTLHPRCGTTFLIVVVILSIIVGSVVTPLVLPNASGPLGQLETLVLRVSLLPLIAALGYEFQRFSARYCSTGPLRFVNYPGFLYQKITTREPDDKQIEVAIAAMQSAIYRETAKGKGQQEVIETFTSLDGVLARFAS